MERDCGIESHRAHGGRLNPKAIAEKVTRILEDEELYQKLSENSRKAFEETYNWQREEKRLIQLYEELLHEH